MSEPAAEFLAIAVLGLATYAFRIGGYLVLARLERLNPRVEAALDAVPAAVIAALVAPVALATGIAESITVAVIVVAALRLP
ncbi:MAG: AzlD domain-containing protein, partial [Pseudomonadales bacterium]|nr:AzlD domain-containing protein [Pseudomonadales bacterium]